MLSLLYGVLVLNAAEPPPQAGACSPDVTAARISSLVSIDPGQAKKLVDHMHRSGRAIVMRPIGEGAPKRRDQGSPPKPLAIKYKTCNAIDVALGAPVYKDVQPAGDCRALLVLFKPRMPANPPDDRVMRAKLRDRFAQRAKEWDDAHRDKYVRWSGARAVLLDEKCIKKGKPEAACQAGVRTADGFVRPTDTRKPFTGDLDLFDIADGDGHPIETGDKDKQALIDAMIADPALDVLHGAHMDWDTTYVDDGDDLAKLENIRQPILDKHRERPIGSATREPLVILRTDCTVCNTWAPPHPADPKAKGAAEADWQYACIADDVDLKSPKDLAWPPKKPPPLQLKYKAGDRLFIRVRPSAPDTACFAVTITKAVDHKDGYGTYEFTNEGGGKSGGDSQQLERRVCAGPPPQQPRQLMLVGSHLEIKPGPDSPDSECFPITITKVSSWSDGTASYEFKNAGGGYSGDDADSLAARTCH